MINVKGKSPTMERVNGLKEEDCFWKKRDQSLYTIIKKNCYTKRIEEEGKIVVYNLSLGLILTIDKTEWVVQAHNVEITTKARREA